MQILPYPQSVVPKKAQMAHMFDHISARYDLLNRVFSFRTDVVWRKRALGMLLPFAPKRLLDVATGTADLALQASKMLPNVRIDGIDLSEGMLSVARKKVQAQGLQAQIALQRADAEALPFGDAQFDAVTVGFGLRNFENPLKGLQEMYRVLRPGGKVLILEFSNSKVPLLSAVFRFYFRYIMPFLGRFVSGHATAYTYLPRSVAAFAEGRQVVSMLDRTSFQNIICKPLSLGIASLYFAQK